MPRRPLGQDGSIRRLKRKHGFVWRVDVYDPWGRRIRKDFPDRATAEAFLAEIRRQKVLAKLGVRPEKAAEGTITLKELATRYLEWAKGAKSWNTVRRDLHRLRRIIDVLGDYELKDINKSLVAQFLTDLRERGLSPASVNRHLALIKHMMSKAAEWGYIPDNPLRGLRGYKEPPGRVRFLTPEEAGRLIAECKVPRLRTMVMLALYTGMRAGEIKNLTWDDIDLENRVIRVRVSKTKARFIPIPDPLLDYLKGLEPKRGPVVGEYWYEKSFRAAAKRAGLEDFNFHDLRHTFASWRAMAGVDLRTLAELLGHRTLKMVMRYSHLMPEHLDAIRNAGMPSVTNWSPKSEDNDR